MERSIKLSEKNMTETEDGYSYEFSEETIKEVESLLSDFRKNNHADYSELKFLINGEEYFMYRCIKKPNRPFSWVSNKEQFDWWNGDGTWNSGMKNSLGFERPRGFFQFDFGNIKNADARHRTAIWMCKKFVMNLSIRRELKEVA